MHLVCFNDCLIICSVPLHSYHGESGEGNWKWISYGSSDYHTRYMLMSVHIE